MSRFFLGLTLLLMVGCATSMSKKIASKDQKATGGETLELIKYDYTPFQLTDICDKTLAKTKTQLDEIPNLKEKNFESVMMRFENIVSDAGDILTPLTFMGYVSRDADLRKASSRCEEKVSQAFVEVFTRKDLYDALKNVKGKTQEEKRLVSETIKSFERNGLKLSADKLIKVRELRQKLSSLETAFTENLNNDTSSIELKASELDGVSPQFLSRLKKVSGDKYLVTTKYTDYEQVMENAKPSSTRKKMYEAFNRRGGQKNIELLEEAIVVREQIADLMGYKNWADYRMSDRMAKTSKRVLEFLHNLESKLKARNKSDLKLLLKYKKEEMEPDATKLNAWDVNYCIYQLKKRDFALDDDEIRDYFPSQFVLKGIFDIYSKLLGVTFEKVENAKVWADQVFLYKILNTKDKKLVAYFFTDLTPREGKYGHAAAFTLTSGRMVNGSYNHPVSSIVANFNPSTKDRPSLLNHHEVETFFHEFGHIMHQTLTRAPYASLSGSGVSHDFVEAPSQMLENWVWNTKILNILSGYYKDTDKKLPPKLIKQMLAARDFNSGNFYTRQLTFALSDMEIHTQNKKVDVVKVFDQIYKDLVGIDPVPGSLVPAGFGHIMGGYDAGYYAYLWSEVYAEDMFTKFEGGKILDSKIGAKYRKNILEPGNMVDADQIIKDFLGRKPNSKAFFKRLGIK